MGINFRLTSASCLIAFAVLANTAAHADGVGAGTLIENTATATYDDGDGPVTIPSNTVTVRVDELLDVAVTSLNSGPVSANSESAVLSFEITNTGNGPEAFILTANPAVAGNDFDTTIDSIAVDSNGNGVYDPGVDTILAGPETTAILAADENLTVFVIVSVPVDAPDDTHSEVDLSAEAASGTGAPGTIFAGQGVDGGDAIVGVNGAADNALGSILLGVPAVDLVKSAVVADPFGGSSAVPGSIVTYTITANVTGSGSVSDLVITDVFPTGTTYEAGSLELDGSNLTDASDTDAGEATATGISVDLGTVAGGTSHSITFRVSVD